MPKAYSAHEVLSDLDKTFGIGKTLTPTTNAVTVTLAAVAGKRHYVVRVSLMGTAGSGSAESLSLTGGADTYAESFVVGTDKVIELPYPACYVGAENTAVVVSASATNLTAGKVYVMYFTR